MKILHTESSKGWGGQEIRILTEAEGLAKRGYCFIFAVARGSCLGKAAKEKGFIVYELSFTKMKVLYSLYKLIHIIRIHQVDLVNTHSSFDAWLGGIAARLCSVPIVRTRHLSTPTRSGINSLLIFRVLADFVVTTSSKMIPILCRQARIPIHRCRMVATGVDPVLWSLSREEGKQFRKSRGIAETDFLVGTLCVVRSWKGIQDLIMAAHLLRDVPGIQFVIVGGGFLERYKKLVEKLSLQSLIHFIGHMEHPQPAVAAMDLFVLLSTSNEGISQATLQAAYCGKPLLTTSIGGLPEVCIDGKTGLVVPPFSPELVAKSILFFKKDAQSAISMGQSAKALVEERFLLHHTLDAMQEVFTQAWKASQDKQSPQRTRIAP